MDFKNPLVQKIAIAIGIICVAIYFSNQYLFTPKKKEIKKLIEDIKALDKKIKELELAEKQYQEMQKRIEELNKEFENTKKKIPSAQELPALISSVADLANKNDIEVNRLTVGQSTKGELYTTHDISFEVDGSYSNMVKFFDDIGHMERITRISNIDLKPLVKKNKKITRATFKLLTYTQ